ncbi:hypothetical protein N7E81_03540 [Reichenbachiella carrageenanivorans]|uniref:Outer membrane protein beta-barrel domain-containing protein n=1 Tax=Reichenbachiella carrageenanivorans TaxID=2979869 RepID=A0ABY6D542_9BACT|nr:hypothetical protein [Reichenbachiella carrageenanivorans]UXX80173.1 hypothetical protein N7E81_03540 [Reichenbachiella carrageenanivorans]
MQRKLILISCLVLLATSGFAQSSGQYEYTKEFIWGVNKNTNGGLIGGFVMKFSSAISETQFRTIGFELMNVKHPKEFRRNSVAGNPFIYGKSNYLYAIRAQYGRDFILFRKSPQQGVQINASIAAGPTIGIVAPYYVKVASGGGDRGQAVPFGYDPRTTGSSNPMLYSYQSITGTGHLFQGLGESSIKPGLNLKAAMVFELGSFKSNVTGFEIGTLIEAYAGQIELMPEEDNRSMFISAFITLFYGHRK